MLSGCGRQVDSIERISNSSLDSTEVSQQESSYSRNFPVEYDGMNQEVVLNGNRPTFTDSDLDLSKGVWQSFSDLDQFNRVGIANALIGKELFPTEAREPLTVKPTGWRQKILSDGQWLYNRCHLIGFQLTGENDNMKNLMTGTRQFNTPHMLNYENQIMDYIRLSGNHVRYRVTPHFIDDELVARGVQLEAASVEADDFAYNVYVFNVQDGYSIDYKTGKATKV
ncbi:DNA/RNA non-specific endonuclease [Enterococcus sp. DIV0849a]|nr:DNA/RNA non-specific endonuclease [Enterococcus sp. DIV0849a]